MRLVADSHLTMDELSRHQFATSTAGIFTYLSSMSASSLCLSPVKYNREELLITVELLIIHKISFVMNNGVYLSL